MKADILKRMAGAGWHAVHASGTGEGDTRVRVPMRPASRSGRRGRKAGARAGGAEGRPGDARHRGKRAPAGRGREPAEPAGRSEE